MKKLMVILVACLLLFSLASCKKNSTTTSQSTSQVSASQSSAVGTKSTGPKELVFWTRMNDNFDAEIKKFEEANPGVTVKRVGIGTEYDDLQTKYIASARSGDLPHVGLVSQRYGIPQIYDAGVIVPIEELMTQDEIDDIIDAYWDRYSYKGQKVAMPLQVSMPVLYINTDLLNEKGLSVPKTWDELVSVAKELTQDTNGDGITDIYGFGIPNDAPWYLNGFFKSAGATVIADEKNVNIDQPQVVEFLKAIQQMVADGSMPANQHTTAKDDFKNGTLAMLINSCAGNASLAKGINGRFEYHPYFLPEVNGQINAPLGGNGIAVFKSNPEMEELAWKFVQFLTSTDSYVGFTMSKGYVPTRKSSLVNPEVQARINDPFWKETFEQLDDLYGQPINPVDATIWTGLNSILSTIEENPKADVAKLVKNLQKEINDFLEDY